MSYWSDEKKQLTPDDLPQTDDQRPAHVDLSSKKKPVVIRRPAGTFKPWVPPDPVEAEDQFSLGATRSQMPPRPPLVHGDARYMTYDQNGKLRTVTSYRSPTFRDPVVQRPGKKNSSNESSGPVRFKPKKKVTP
jgi:hypothetical protein